MPELPPITAKVKVDTSGATRAEVELKAFSESVKASLDRSATPAIERFSERSGQAFVKFGKDGELAALRITSSTATTRSELARLEERAKTFAETAGRDLGRAGTAVVRLGEDGAVALTKMSATLEETSSVASRAAGAIGSMATTVVGAIPAVGGMAESLADMGPAGVAAAAGIAAVTVAAVEATAPVIALGAGLAGVLAVGGGVLGAFAALGAGAAVLAVHTHGWAAASGNLATAQANLKAAQDAYNVSVHGALTPAQRLAEAQKALAQAQKDADNPLTRLTDHIGHLADALGEQATPAATTLFDWLGKLSDSIAPSLGQLLGWFNQRLPSILPIVNRLMGDVGSALKGLGDRLGPIVDDWIKHPQHFEQAFKDTVNKVTSLIGDVIQKSGELAQWWAEHHTDLEVVASGTFFAIGETAHLAAVIFSDLALASTRVVDAVRTIERSAASATDQVGRLGLALSRLPGLGGLTAGAVDLVSLPGSSGRRAAGGPVIPGGIYSVGETAPETLVMGERGGYVIPAAPAPRPGMTVNLTVNGVSGSAQELAAMVAAELAWQAKTRYV